MSLSFTKRPSLKVDLDYTTRAWMKAKGRRSLTAYCCLFARCRWSAETACVIDNTRRSGGGRPTSRGILRQRENRTWWTWLQHGLYGVTGGDDCYLWWVSSIGTLSASSSPAGQHWVSTDRRHQRHQGIQLLTEEKWLFARNKHTRARVQQTHTIGQGVLHYLLQRSVTRKEKGCCYPTMKGLVVTSGFGSDGSCLQPSQHHFSHMWPMICAKSENASQRC